MPAMSNFSLSGLSFRHLDLFEGRQIDGTDDRDRLFGRFGDDTLNGFGGDDLLFGGFGDDIANGGDGDDRLFGGFGDDILVGNRGNDRVSGGFGDDLLIWNNGDGSDELRGGFGYDTVQVNFDTDLVNDDLQNDDVVRIEEAGRGVNLARTALNGQAEVGLFALDVRSTERLEVNGGGGEDTVQVVGEVATEIDLDLDGGADAADDRDADGAEDLAEGDTIDLSSFGAGVLVDLDENNQGVLQAENDNSNTTRQGLSEFGNIQIAGEIVIDALDDFENVIGTDFDDTIFGNAQNNVLLGGAGNDVLHPFGGDDFVDGGDGIDTLLLNGFPLGSLVDVEAGTASFLGVTDGPVNTFANIENVNGSTVAGDVIRGDANANVLNGLGGDDSLFGGDGDDTLIGGDNVDRARADAQGENADLLQGGTGADRLTGGLGADGFGYADAEGGDTITDFSIDEDRFVLDAESFGLGDGAAVAFQNVARDGDGTDAGLVDVEGGNNVYVLQGGFENAGAAADALALALAGGEDEGAGFFVYFNVNQGRSRLFQVDDLDDVDSDIQQLANLTDGGPDNADAVNDLPDFTADNFSFDSDILFA